MPQVTNRQKRAWIVPATETHPLVILNPGQEAPVPDEQWNELKGLPVIKALLDMRALTVGKGRSIEHEDELQNTPSPKAPEDLKQDPSDPDVKAERKDQEVVEVKTAPAEVRVAKK